MAHCDTQRDFVSHLGGDDFLVLFQSIDWHLRCERIVASLAAGALELFDPQAREAGGIQAEDRHGVLRFFPCTTLSIGAVVADPGHFLKAEDVATGAAEAKHYAKKAGSGLFVLVRQTRPGRRWVDCGACRPHSGNRALQCLFNPGMA